MVRLLFSFLQDIFFPLSLLEKKMDREVEVCVCVEEEDVTKENSHKQAAVRKWRKGESVFYSEDILTS